MFKRKSKQLLKFFPSLSRKINILNRKIKINSKTAYPDWKKLIEKYGRDKWNKKINNSSNNKNILIATGAVTHLGCATIESMLAVALSLRGTKTSVLLNDGVLPACIECSFDLFGNSKYFIEKGSSVLLEDCWNSGKNSFVSSGANILKYSEYLFDEDLEKAKKIIDSTSVNEIKNYRLDNLSIGEHAMAGALRFFAKGSIDDELHKDEVLQKYFLSSLLSLFALRNLFSKSNFDAVVLNHGIYVPQGIVVEAAKEAKIRVVTWNPGYRRNRFIFSHHDTYHHTLISEPLSKWNDIKWNKSVKNEVVRYLNTRYYGTEDWISFQKKPNFKLGSLEKKLAGKPTVCALTSVMWDAQLHYKSNAFKSMVDWMIKTIEYFQKRQDINLVIRIHPAEINGALPSRQLMEKEIKQKFPKLEKNIFIIKPNDNLSTYALTNISDSVIIYNTKTGIELASKGIPVIVAGEAWIRNKGFSIDVSNEENYESVLNKIPFNNKIADTLTDKALKYAFHFFYRRMIPLSFMKSLPGRWPPYIINCKSISELFEGEDKGLDIICNGILNNTDFIYPEEEFTNYNEYQ